MLNGLTSRPSPANQLRRENGHHSSYNNPNSHGCMNWSRGCAGVGAKSCRTQLPHGTPIREPILTQRIGGQFSCEPFVVQFLLFNPAALSPAQGPDDTERFEKNTKVLIQPLVPVRLPAWKTSKVNQKKVTGSRGCRRDRFPPMSAEHSRLDKR